MADLAKRWTWIRDGDTLVDELDDVVLAIDDPEYISAENKRLIAAAPRLLAALDNLCQSWERRRGREDAEASYRDAIAALYEAVGLDREVKA